MASFAAAPDNAADVKKGESEGASGQSTKRRLMIWVHCEDDEGRSFFYEHASGSSVWELPRGPDDWLETDDPETGEKFYYNAETDLSTWEHPATAISTSSWLECIDNATGRTFYYHVQKRKSVWRKPSDDNMEDTDRGNDTAVPSPDCEQSTASLKAKMDAVSLNTPNLVEESKAQDGDAETRYLPKAEAAPSRPSLSSSSRPSLTTTARSSSVTAGPAASASRAASSSLGSTGSRQARRSLSVGGGEEMAACAEGEYHDYVLKEGGGTTVFGRKSWKRRFMVLKHGELGWFRSFKEYAGGAMPLKGRWTSLATYRLEEMLQDNLGIRLIPVNPDASTRVWNIRCDDLNKKHKCMEAMAPHIVSRSFVKSLDKVLSGRRFLSVAD